MYYYTYLFQICICMFLRNTMTTLVFRLAHEILNIFSLASFYNYVFRFKT